MAVSSNVRDSSISHQEPASSYPGCQRFFFRSEAAIVSRRRRDRDRKNPLDAAVTNLTSMRTCFNLGH